jgi:hypothetical protein
MRLAAASRPEPWAASPLVPCRRPPNLSGRPIDLDLSFQPRHGLLLHFDLKGNEGHERRQHASSISDTLNIGSDTTVILRMDRLLPGKTTSQTHRQRTAELHQSRAKQFPGRPSPTKIDPPQRLRSLPAAPVAWSKRVFDSKRGLSNRFRSPRNHCSSAWCVKLRHRRTKIAKPSRCCQGFRQAYIHTLLESSLDSSPERS